MFIYFISTYNISTCVVGRGLLKQRYGVQLLKKINNRVVVCSKIII